MQAYDKNGEVFVSGETVSLKLDTNLQVSVKDANDSQYSAIGYKVPYGLSMHEKKMYMQNFYDMLTEEV